MFKDIRNEQRAKYRVDIRIFERDYIRDHIRSSRLRLFKFYSSLTFSGISFAADESERSRSGFSSQPSAIPRKSGRQIASGRTEEVRPEAHSPAGGFPRNAIKWRNEIPATP